jgi:hypothetical protein
MSGTRKVAVSAIMKTQYNAVVEVPENVTDDEVLEYYRNNGASGEFVPDMNTQDWEWLGATSANNEEDVDMDLSSSF